MKTVKASPPARQARDMTEGNPIRQILAFALPILIGNIFQQVYAIVDTMVVGYSLGDSAIAAIGATSSLSSLLVSLATGMNSGYGIVVSRYFGAHDHKRLRQSILGMLILNMMVAALVTVFSLLYLRPLLRYMNTPEALLSQAHTYLVILCGGSGFYYLSEGEQSAWRNFYYSPYRCPTHYRNYGSAFGNYCYGQLHFRGAELGSEKAGAYQRGAKKSNWDRTAVVHIDLLHHMDIRRGAGAVHYRYF